MERPIEAQQAINAALEIFKDKPRSLSLSPYALEITRRDLEAAPTTPRDLQRSPAHLPPILDPEHIAHTLHKKILQAFHDFYRNNTPPSVNLNGREVDYITDLLVPYQPSKKPDWVTTNTYSELARYLNDNPNSSHADLQAYRGHAENLAKTHLGMREGAVRELHESWEKTGGERRQSFIDRMALFEAKT